MNSYLSLRKKHMILLLCAFVMISPSLAQKRLIGVPLFDKHLNLGKCKLCNDRDSKSNEQIKSFTKNYPFQNVDVFSKKQIDSFLNYCDHEFQDSDYTVLTKAYILFAKADFMGSMVNFSDSDFLSKEYLEDKELPSANIAFKITNLYDTLLKMDLDNETKIFLRKTRMLTFQEIGLLSIFESISPMIFENKNTEEMYDLTYKQLADKYFQDESYTEFIPFQGYLGLNLGLSGNMGKYNLMGAEVSYEWVTNRNPFNNEGRIDIIGLVYHKESGGNRNEFLFNFLNFKKIYIASVNLFQFGLQSGLTNEWNWCYRPQLGYAYGPFQIGYAYNITFNAEARKNANGHLFTFNFSYPLIRIGKYQ
jgi:hypothetical protein